VLSRSSVSDEAGRVLHTPVLLAEAMELLGVRPGGFWVDGTLGLGGHASEILRLSAPNGRLLAVDKDGEALALASERLTSDKDRVRFVHDDWRNLGGHFPPERPDGILLDLGVSSLQFDDPARGFSFQNDGPLDMRMDRSGGETAAEIVNRAGEKELADLIFAYGEDPASRRIARGIVAARKHQRIRTTTELAEIVRRSAGHTRRGIHPATRTFQALRIVVNRELQGLGESLRLLAHRLAAGGRMVVISFHSLEDREVKMTFRELAREGFRILTKKPLVASDAEVRSNPRSRSAKMRGIERETGAERAQEAA
jgi:16S rRNA (cytosine1402-N4)-methyltransferase